MSAAETLTPVVERWLDRIAEVGRSLAHLRDERARARRISDTVFDEFGAADLRGAVRRTHRIASPRGSLRIDEYRPADATGPLPACLVLHGGAFRLGELDEHINVAFCARRAVDAGYALFAVDYALAPEHPHPAAQTDTMLALEWLVGEAAALGIAPTRVVVSGVSAGGALAAALCVAARDAGIPVHGQLLEVPVVDLSSDAMWLGEYGPLNGLDSLASIREGYVGGADLADPVVSPLLADLRDLPPTHVMVAEYDPLRAGGEQFVRALRESGNDVSGSRHLGALHGSQGLLKEHRDARLWHEEVVAVLKDFAARPAR